MQPQQLSYADASRYIRNRPGKAEAMGRDGWVLPSVHSAICTLDFLEKVRNKVVYCPKEEDVVAFKKCYSRPTRAVLLKYLEEAF